VVQLGGTTGRDREGGEPALERLLQDRRAGCGAVEFDRLEVFLLESPPITASAVLVGFVVGELEVRMKVASS
jgi:hypothetical protein